LRRLTTRQDLTSFANTLPSGSEIRASWRNSTQQVGLFRYRASYVFRYYWARIRTGVSWLFVSRESSNFTYDLTPRNEEHLAELLAFVLQRPVEEIAGYVRELRQDHALRDAVSSQVEQLGRQGGYDPDPALWPPCRLVRAGAGDEAESRIETGIEKGLGAMVLCATLLRNAHEGHQGCYYGTDIDRGAGMLLTEPYRAMGTILYGDSIKSLSTLDLMVDVFINDSDHSADYEKREYRLIAPKLSERAVIIGDNAHVTDELLKFSRETGRQFLFFREEPADHWYLGAGIGLSFKAPGERG
jgi:Methyltransferase domain